MKKVIDWRRSDDPRDVIHIAVQTLAEGHLVAFASDGYYMVAASALRSEAWSRLIEGSHAAAKQVESATVNGSTSRLNPSVSILPRSPEEVLDYAPHTSAIGLRLAARAWPGPLKLILKNGHESSLAYQLDPEVLNSVTNCDGCLAFELPKHPAVQQIARLSSGPILLAPVRSRGASGWVQRAEDVSDEVTLVIDADSKASINKEQSSPFLGPTVVRVVDNRCILEQEGVLPVETVQSYTQLRFLFVCTGNTCRSPMAAAMLRKKLTDHAKSNGLSASAIAVASAGVSASTGDSASDGAVEAMAGLGIDLLEHRSQSVTEELVNDSDLILTMTNRHRQLLINQWPHIASKVSCLSPDGRDVADPFGGPTELYQACAKRIDQFLDHWLSNLDSELLPLWTETK